tara:strand:- start:323 stop:562 length:240 start_codon:yes stop_codon:yes gene_type:complete
MEHTRKQLLAIRRKYLRNEDRNFHSENLQLLADNFGTEEEQKETARRVASLSPDFRPYELPIYISENVGAYWGEYLAKL